MFVCFEHLLSSSVSLPVFEHWLINHEVDKRRGLQFVNPSLLLASTLVLSWHWQIESSAIALSSYHAISLSCYTLSILDPPLRLTSKPVFLTPGTEMQAISGLWTRHVKRSRKTLKDSETPNRWFSLPREIRDEIYREVLCKRYLVRWRARWKRGKAVCNEPRPLFWFRGTHVHWMGMFWSGHGWMKKRPLFWAEIALLLTSKAISQEAMEIMYEESLFRVYVGQRLERYRRLTPIPSPQLLDRMKNIEVQSCVCDILGFTASETWFKDFNSGHINHISLTCYHCSHDDHTPFLQACQSLVGFKTVTIIVEFFCVYDEEEEEEELLTLYDSIRDDFRDALEPHLGSSQSYDTDRAFFLEFHPRKHVEDVQTALTIGGGQALALEEDTESGATTRLKSSFSKGLTGD